MSKYAWALFLSGVFPFILSFYPPLKFYRNIKALIKSLFLIVILFGAWDVFATWRGHWSFDPAGVWSFRIVNLPLEEVLFFVVIPFCCIFTWEVGKYLVARGWGLGAGGWGLGGSEKEMKEYTILAVLSVLIAVYADRKLGTGLLKNKLFYGFLVVITAFKLMVNGFLTSSSIVMYDPRFYLGIRIGSIPVEDFMFGFSMVTLTIVFWEYFKKEE